MRHKARKPDKNGEYHSPHFPAYKPRKLYERTLAMYQERTITTIDGELLDVPDLASLKDAMFEHNLLVLTQKLIQLPFIDEMVEDEDCEVLVSERGLNAIRVTRGNKVRWLGQFESWALPAELASLSIIADTIEYLGCGPAVTPSGLGLNLMRQHAKEDERWLWVMPGPVWNVFHDNIIGGRDDNVQSPQSLFDTAYELDFTMAYPYEARQLPAGPRIDFFGHIPERAVTYYAEADITYTRKCKLGPLPVRNLDNPITYPTEGSITGWYWKEELDCARKAGAIVQVRQGFAWGCYTALLSDWSLFMYDMRMGAPSTEVAALVKLSANAAIGRFGVQRSTASLVRAKPGIELYADSVLGQSNEWGIIREQTEHDTLLVHVTSYINAMVRVRLYKVALEEAEAECLIATNFDAVITTRVPDSHTRTGYGGWRVECLHNLSVPAARHLVCDEKKRRPGIRRAG